MGTLIIYWRDVVRCGLRNPVANLLGPTPSEWAAFDRSLNRHRAKPLG